MMLSDCSGNDANNFKVEAIHGAKDEVVLRGPPGPETDLLAVAQATTAKLPRVLLAQ